MVLIKKQMAGKVVNGYGGINGRKYITIHETANTARGATAQTHANLQSNGFSASWHWQVDDTQAIQSFPHTAQLWHAGDGRGNGNLNSIGIEICVNSDGNFKKAVDNAAELVKKIMEDENISLANVVQHNHWSGKNCPTNLRNGSKGVTWSQFKNKIKNVNSVDNDILQLQKDLKKLGYDPGTIDGIDGPNTKEAVKAFQGAEGLTVDGIAGKKTKSKIKHIKNGGMTLSEYKKVMKKINSLENKLNKKVSVPNKTNEPSNSHKDGWDFVKGNNISNGKDAHGYVTRQQLATMLKKYDDIRFSDKEEPSESHEIAWQWLVDIGVTNGIDPRKPLTREQFASLLLKYNDLVNVEEELDAEKVAKAIYPELRKIEERKSRVKGQ